MTRNPPSPGEVRGKLHVGFQDFLVRAQGVVVVEGGISGEHLEDEDTQRPPVHRRAETSSTHVRPIKTLDVCIRLLFAQLCTNT